MKKLIAVLLIGVFTLAAPLGFNSLDTRDDIVPDVQKPQFAERDDIVPTSISNQFAEREEIVPDSVKNTFI